MVSIEVFNIVVVLLIISTSFNFVQFVEWFDKRQERKQREAEKKCRTNYFINK